MSKKQELAKDYFERHQLSNECHVTSDLRVFHQKSNAESFAANLKDSSVESFTRAEVVSQESEETDANAALLAFNPEATDFKAAKELAKLLDLKVEGKSKEDYIAALSAAKADLENNQ